MHESCRSSRARELSGLLLARFYRWLRRDRIRPRVPVVAMGSESSPAATASGGDGHDPRARTLRPSEHRTQNPCRDRPERSAAYRPTSARPPIRRISFLEQTASLRWSERESVAGLASSGDATNGGGASEPRSLAPALQAERSAQPGAVTPQPPRSAAKVPADPADRLSFLRRLLSER